MVNGLKHADYLHFEGHKFYIHFPDKYKISMFNSLGRHMKTYGSRTNLDLVRAQGKKLFCEFYNIPEGKLPGTNRLIKTEELRNYPGFSIDELNALQNHFEFNAVFYDIQPNKYAVNLRDYEKTVTEFIIDPSFPTYKFLIFHINDEEHIDPLFNETYLDSYLVRIPSKPSNKNKIPRDLKPLCQSIAAMNFK